MSNCFVSMQLSNFHIRWATVLVFVGSPIIIGQEQQPGDEIRLPVPMDGVYEGEFHLHHSGRVRVQQMTHYGKQWSRGSQLLWDGVPGDVCSLKFRVRHESRYKISVRMTKAVDYGRFVVRVDSKMAKKNSQMDFYSPNVVLAEEQLLGEYDLKSGIHEMAFRLLNGNSKAKPFRKDRFLMGIDYLRIEDLNPAHRVESGSAAAMASKKLDFAATHQLLSTYCFGCHGEKQQEGKLNLQSLGSKAAFENNLDLTQKIASAILQGEMPPEDAKQPSRKTQSLLGNTIQDWVDDYAQRSGTLTPIVMRRLNRYEYSNAVRDLLHLKGDIYPLPERTIRSDAPYFDPASRFLPNDIRVGNRTLGKFQIEQQILTGVVPFAIDLQAEHGFNNRGDELSISPILLETFLKLARAVLFSPEFNAYCRDYEQLFVEPKVENLVQLRDVTQRRLQKLLTRAFRSPVDPQTFHRYVTFFQQEFERTNSYEKSMKQTVVGILASPRFLFVQEKKNALPRVQRLNDFELATRLSFFLWSTIPSEKLLEAALAGHLSDSAHLEQIIREMLLDAKSKALSDNFARQWLRLDQLITAVPDPERFPTYYSRIGCEYWKMGLQMMIEPLLLFESVLVEDLSILNFVDCNFAYRSDELQTWYDDSNPFSSKGENRRFNTNQQVFKRRALNSTRQGGVLTTAAVMTMTSAPLRTSPITRGSWVAGVIFNRPPDPPPDVVPEIEADDEEIEAQGLTLRQRLSQHQTNTNCAACHAKIDPLGFVLENYDAIGRWRDTYRSGLKIDTRGKLGELQFDDIGSFKQSLVDRPEIFVRAFGEHMLSYALGRKLSATDKPAVDKIVRNVLADEGQFSTLIVEVAMSRPFLYKASQHTDHQ